MFHSAVPDFYQVFTFIVTIKIFCFQQRMTSYMFQYHVSVSAFIQICQCVAVENFKLVLSCNCWK